jgi:hypothetical protein
LQETCLQPETDHNGTKNAAIESADIKGKMIAATGNVVMEHDKDQQSAKWDCYAVMSQWLRLSLITITRQMTHCPRPSNAKQDHTEVHKIALLHEIAIPHISDTLSSHEYLVPW